jgi:hypothetical protein
MANESKKGIVYIVQNPAFPHLFKIGYTEKDTVEARGLNASMVPEDFNVLLGYECDNPEEVEEHLHKAHKNYRHYTITGRKTEFFYVCCLQEAKKTLELLKSKGVKEISVIPLKEDDTAEYDEAKNIEELTGKKTPHREWSNKISEEKFYLKRNKCKCTVIWQEAKKIVLKEGSELDNYKGSLKPKDRDGLESKTKKYSGNGFIKDDVVVKDISDFKSLNEAAMFCNRGSIYVWNTLKNKEGKTLDQVCEEIYKERSA